LAREAARDDINGNSIPSKNVGCEGSNVMVYRHLRPVFRQYAAGEFFDFAERYGLETACAFQAKAESADAAKKIKDAHHSAASWLMVVMASAGA
jgi:hypothetical protein